MTIRSSTENKQVQIGNRENIDNKGINIIVDSSRINIPAEYTSQYSNQYNDRTLRQGTEIEEYLRSRYKREYIAEDNKKEILLIGTLAITTPTKPVISKVFHKVNCIQEPDWRITNPEYYLEDKEMERIKIQLPEKDRETAVNGTVLGVVGTKTDNIFIVSEVFYPIDSYQGQKENKRRRKEEQQDHLIMPNINTLKPEQIPTLIKYIKETNPGKIVLLEGIVRQEYSTLYTTLRQIPITPADTSILSETISKGLTEEREEREEREEKSILSGLVTGDQKYPEENILCIPGENDCTLFMLPYRAPAQIFLETPRKSTKLSNPSIFELNEYQIVVCPYISLRETMRYLNTIGSKKIEDYYKAQEIHIRSMHIAPTAPDTTPIYPSDIDPFVLGSIPDIIVTRVPQALAGTSIYELPNGRKVHLVILSETSNGILVISKEKVEMVKIV
ncbi:DNA polymerase delta subunit 2 [Nematocida sp. AWRm80]|nr:DNA polymerase delta subunit 2 [Nematocida sp. AWRm80]